MPKIDRRLTFRSGAQRPGPIARGRRVHVGPGARAARVPRVRYEILVRVPSRGIKDVLKFDSKADLYAYLRDLLREEAAQFEATPPEIEDLLADLQEPFDERVVEDVLALLNEDVYAQYEFLGAR